MSYSFGEFGSPSMATDGYMGDMTTINEFLNTDLFDNDNASPAPAFVAKQEVPSFTEPAKTARSLLPQQQMSGPSHDYSNHRQSTGIDPRGLETTFAATQFLGYNVNGDVQSPQLTDFSSAESLGARIAAPSPFAATLSSQQPVASQNFLPTMDFSYGAVRSSSVGSSEPSTPSAQNRFYAGIHSQQAQARQAAQLQQQQQMIRQVQEQQRQLQSQQSLKRELSQGPQSSLSSLNQLNTSPQAPSAAHPSQDYVAERTIRQVLTRLRNAPSAASSSASDAELNRLRAEEKKEDDDMDEDERLLKSEEGKSLTSAQRRQLRNKVSARAFRHRRKEYIAHLEEENNNLQTESAGLRNENAVLRNLVKDMLTRSPAIAGYLDSYVQEASGQPQQQPQQQQQSPYSQQQAQQLMQIPEEARKRKRSDLESQMLDFEATGFEGQFDFNNTPSVNSLNFNQNINLVQAPHFDFGTLMNDKVDVPEPLDLGVLSGKTSNFVGSMEEFDADEEKPQMPAVEVAPAAVETPVADEVVDSVIDEEFENDPIFALYHQDAPEPVAVSAVAQIESQEPVSEEVAMAQVQRLDTEAQAVSERLAQLTFNM